MVLGFLLGLFVLGLILLGVASFCDYSSTAEVLGIIALICMLGCLVLFIVRMFYRIYKSSKD